MGAYDFTINMMQSSQLSEHAETIEELNKKCDLLYEWVKYLNSELEKLKESK